jgi:bacterioferritin-associated ferredoxin
MRKEIAGGARTPAEVFRAHGCAPQCGSCVPYVKNMIGEARNACAAARDVPAVAAE